MPVRGYDDLFVLLVERVEGVEERFLGFDLTFEELYIVDEQDVILPVALLKIQRRIVPDRVDEVVGEVFARHIANPHARVLILDVLANGVEQVCLTETYTTIDEERVVDDPWCLGDSQGRGVSEPVAGADNEGVEGVFGLEG